MNSYGHTFRITSFGESHGKGIGVVIDGCPAGLRVDLDMIQYDLDRRRPGQSRIVSPRNESDRLEVLSGLFEGVTTGMPITFHIANKDAKPRDYSHIKDAYRPSHADFTYQQKYGIRDYRGGGRSSARETIARVAAGALARQVLGAEGMSIQAYVSQVGSIRLDKSYEELDLTLTEDSIVRCPDPMIAKDMIDLIEVVRDEGDTIGGVVSCVASGVPVGLGEPVFDKLHAELGKAMLSINAVKGFEYGSGFGSVGMRGSAHNDRYATDASGEVTTTTNHSGGIQGGISNGLPIYFSVAFKPVATLLQKQMTVNTNGEETEMVGKGRHDPCVVPRAVPIVEAMACLVLVDFVLRNRC